MKPIELKNGIYWVGAIDWSIRDFHGYETPRGTTYNNYLILDNEITLVDTVKHDFSDITIENIRAIVDPAKIKHIVINHIENDHVTSIDKIMALCPDATIHISAKGEKGLARFYDLSKWKIRIVKSVDTPLSRNADAPLARFDDDLYKRGKAAYQPRRLRSTHRVSIQIR